jgi:hypothetical protein
MYLHAFHLLFYENFEKFKSCLHYLEVKIDRNKRDAYQHNKAKNDNIKEDYNC